MMLARYKFLGVVFYLALIIVNNILNLSLAKTACGMFAGMMMVSPSPMLKASPAIVIVAYPSTSCTMASKGAVCSLSCRPLSKANRLMFPVGFSNTRLLTMLFAEYSMSVLKLIFVLCSKLLIIYSF